LNTKFEKPLRETLRPLKSLKTAKFADFRTQGYQGLTKTHDFAGEAISLRFGWFWQQGEAVPSFKNLETPPTSTKGFFRLVTP
jgi:hypothetical protein